MFKVYIIYIEVIRPYGITEVVLKLFIQDNTMYFENAAT